MPREDYSERVDARRERLERAALRARRESESASKRMRSMMDAIPPGQPILVGHHSERRHRSDLRKIDNAMRTSVERGQDAKRLAEAAASVGSAGISSDDPEALDLLRRKLASLEQQRDDRKRLNAAWRKAKKPAPDDSEGWRKVADIYGCSDNDLRSVRTTFARFPWQKQPFPSYSLTNLGGNIRNVRERIAQLEAQAAEPERDDIEGDGYTIREDRDINRVCVEFDARCSREVCKVLRSFGFKWNRTEGAWTRLLNGSAWSVARMLHDTGKLTERCPEPDCNVPAPCRNH